MKTFQATFAAQVAAAQTQAAAPPLPVEVWAMDESRFGRQTVQRRRITLPGIKPIGHYQHAFENFYVYGAVAPRTGDGYFEARVALNGPEFQAYVDAFGAARTTTFNVLMVDHAKAHRARNLKLPANVALIFQPPYAPELNPTERVWLAIKDDLAWRCFDDLRALQEALAPIIEGLDADTLRSLVAYPYITDAIHALAA